MGTSEGRAPVAATPPGASPAGEHSAGPAPAGLRAGSGGALPAVGRWSGGFRFSLRRRGLLAPLLLAGVAAASAPDLLRSPPRRRARIAARVARTLGRLKGPWAKAGQFAALRHDVLDPEVRAALAALRDRVPPLPLRAVRRVVEKELGGPLETRFRSFGEEPLGAASIAQAHPAELHDGTPVVVKVQYPWLRESLPRDLRLVRRLLRLALAGGSPVNFDRLFSEFTSGLREELDFRREARVADEIRRNLSSEPGVVVPRVHPELSTARVLVLDRHPAIPIDDRAALARRGVDPRAVLEILARAYARQVFLDGLFHADPHPGNLFVIDEPGAAERPRVLFVDFGLSKRLDPTLREEMRRGLMALLARDLEGFLDGMERSGMIAPGARPGVRRAVEGILPRLGSGLPADLGGEGVLALVEEARRRVQETPGLQLPGELLLYARTLAWIFRLGRELAPEADLLRLTLPYLLRFLSGNPGGGPAGDEAPAGG